VELDLQCKKIAHYYSYKVGNPGFPKFVTQVCLIQVSNMVFLYVSRAEDLRVNNLQTQRMCIIQRAAFPSAT
jgi:hypothetical protein